MPASAARTTTLPRPSPARPMVIRAPSDTRTPTSLPSRWLPSRRTSRVVRSAMTTPLRPPTMRLPSPGPPPPTCTTREPPMTEIPSSLLGAGSPSGVRPMRLPSTRTWWARFSIATPTRLAEMTLPAPAQGPPTSIPAESPLTKTPTSLGAGRPASSRPMRLPISRTGSSADVSRNSTPATRDAPTTLPSPAATPPTIACAPSTIRMPSSLGRGRPPGPSPTTLPRTRTPSVPAPPTRMPCPVRPSTLLPATRLPQPAQASPMCAPRAPPTTPMPLRALGFAAAPSGLRPAQLPSRRLPRAASPMTRKPN